VARLTKQDEAQHLALRGDIESALAALVSLQNAGDKGASASLAEIAAFQGRWQDVLYNTRVVFESHLSFETLNVYTDMVKLVARAASETGDWSTVQGLATLALSKLTNKERDDAKIDAIRRLALFAVAKDADSTFTLRDLDEPLEQRKSRFEAALDFFAKDKKMQRKTPAERIDHLFGLARVYNYEQGALALFDQEKASSSIFATVAFTASALARCGRVEDAWTTIKERLHGWWPVEVTQVAPVILLTDGVLRHLMVHERCEWVLRTPRGPESVDT